MVLANSKAGSHVKYKRDRLLSDKRFSDCVQFILRNT